MAGGLLAAPLAAEAQVPAKVPRIGFLSIGSPTDLARQLEAFRQGLRELGYVEGQTIAIEYRLSEGRPERLPPSRRPAPSLSSSPSRTTLSPRASGPTSRGPAGTLPGLL